ncbi:MAG TPA: peptidylprolyl isomerase [Demequinaceae bacterium]
MATNKQARAQQKRRYEQFQAKIAARQARRQRRQRIIAIVAIVVVLAAFGAFGMVSLQTNDSAAPTVNVTTSPSPTPTATPTATTASGLAPAPSLAEHRTWTATITTNKGVITATLDGAAAPQAVSSFIYLAQKGFFNNSSCHRVVTAGIYVVQCGSPDGTGTGGPGFTFGPVENAPTDDQYPAGTLAMARSGNNAYSMGSQFFFVYRDSQIPSDTAGGYTVFGTITSGLAILEAIGAAGTSDGTTDGAPVEPVLINEVSVE